MIGAIVGDVVGSRFEFANCKSKEFELFTDQCFPTDDSIMTIAIMQAIMDSSSHEELGENAVKSMRGFGHRYPYAGYGGRFAEWLVSENPHPYNSLGNGAAMRVSPVGWFAKSLEECIDMSRAVTEVTHNHPEGIKGAEATAVAVYLARKGWSKDMIKEVITSRYYPLDFTIDKIRQTYRFTEKIQDTVPQALECFFESEDFEDAIRTAISLGGDSDTIGAICGGVAGAYYGVPKELELETLKHLDVVLRSVVRRATKECS